MVADGFGSQLLDSNKYPYTVSDFLDSHLFKYELITLDKILAGDIIDCEYCQ